MSNYEHIELTASEISTLWAQYLNKTMAICGLKHSLNHVADEEIKVLLQDTLNIMNKHVDKLVHIFKKEEYPIPQGFTDHDVNIHAPRLFSDTIYLLYILSTTNLSLSMYAMYLSIAERQDIIEYYDESLSITQQFHKRAKHLAMEKGIYIRSPHLPKPDIIEFVEKQSFLAGWFGNRRPLIGMEIANLAFNAKHNMLGQAAITAFSQVASSKEVRRYFERGREIAGKHSEIFSSILKDEYLDDGASLMTSKVTDSTESPFSDKLMMYFVNSLSSAGIAQYGRSMSESPRHDLGVHYTRLIAEIANYADDGANIMIDNGWMEKPPMAPDRKNLAK
ncbi:DUF3231 family protein [Oceanobacillus salinisoli]|uniref:DUF3231 family protein n=1 Tax=Oceanobacillus salinisoli TaxID=2678611 RepID=UPI0012E28865|nr:DUF3231 family protein [Oceanobacillus salinisoli]